MLFTHSNDINKLPEKTYRKIDVFLIAITFENSMYLEKFDITAPFLHKLILSFYYA